MARKSNPKNSSGSSGSRYIGENTFPGEKPVCRPTAPGRRVKPLSGPVHPGFPKAGSKHQSKDKPLKSTPQIGSRLQISEQTYDLYNTPRQSSAKKRNINKPRKRK